MCFTALLIPGVCTLLWKRRPASFPLSFTSLSPILTTNLWLTSFIQNIFHKSCAFLSFSFPSLSSTSFLGVQSPTPEKEYFRSYTHTWLCESFNYQNVLGRKTLLPSFSAKLVSERRKDVVSWPSGLENTWGKREPTIPINALVTLLFTLVNITAVPTMAQCKHFFWNITSRNRGIPGFHLGPDLNATEQRLRIFELQAARCTSALKFFQRSSLNLFC